MPKRTVEQIAADLEAMGLEGKVVGCHSNITSIGLIAPSSVSEREKKRGMHPVAKTVVNAFLQAVGPQGTFFVPTHSVNFLGGYQPEKQNIIFTKDDDGEIVDRQITDDGFYNKDSSPSTVGNLTECMVFDDRTVRSGHPTHSISSIGKEAQYLAQGHDPYAQAVGIHNAFIKTIGLDGVIFFIGETLKSNTTFHGYETLILPAMAPYFSAGAAAREDGIRRTFPQTWAPLMHRDFYMENVRKTKAIQALHDSGLLKEGKLGRGKAFWFEAKPMAQYFTEEVFPQRPDIMFCNKEEDCSPVYECEDIIKLMTKHYGNGGGWDTDKIKSGMDKDFLKMLESGEQRILY